MKNMKNATRKIYRIRYEKYEETFKECGKKNLQNAARKFERMRQAKFK